MERYAKNFVRASLVYFFLAALLGMGMIVYPSWVDDYLQIHVHFMLIGWMSMMIFGVGYHIIPRFQGHAIIPRRWANFHLLIANVGLMAMGVAWWAGQGAPSGPWLWTLAIGGLLNFVGFMIFAVIMYRGLIPVKHD